MRHRQVIALFLVLIGVGGLVRWAAREPSWEGRPISAWTQDLQSRQPGVREAAIRALHEISAEGVPYLAARVGARPGLAARLAGSIGPSIPEPIKRPFRKLYSPAARVQQRAEAALALRVLGTNAAPALATLSAMLEEPDSLLSYASGEALGAIGPRALPVLLAALDSPHYHARANACRALGQLGTNAAIAVPRLVRIVASEEGPMLSAAAWALASIGTPSVPHLVPLLSHTNWTVRRWSAFSLASMRGAASNAFPALVERTRDEHHQVRWVAVEALAGMNHVPDEISAALRERLLDPDEKVRTAAVEGLAFRHRVIRTHLPEFVRLLDDPAPGVRAATAFALKQVGSNAWTALPALARLQGETNEPAVSASAAQAIRVIQRR